MPEVKDRDKPKARHYIDYHRTLSHTGSSGGILSVVVGLAVVVLLLYFLIR